MVKHTNQRVMITLPKKQLRALERCARNQGLTTSRLISQIISRKVETLMLNIDVWKHMSMDDMIAIAQTKWIDD